LTDSEETNEDYRAYLEEACFHLHKKGLSFEELSTKLELQPGEAELLYRSYENKLRNGSVVEDVIDSRLWADVHDDATGNEKITFARDNGFYHCKKSDLESMDSTALMSIFETSKRFLDYDIYKRYLNSKPPVGYDPMALQRQVGRAITLIEEILEKRYEQEKNSKKQP
jgi:hypothetical protein